jgi:hypothetical protein
MARPEAIAVHYIEAHRWCESVIVVRFSNAPFDRLLDRALIVDLHHLLPVSVGISPPPVGLSLADHVANECSKPFLDPNWTS